jgi:hypothetical protein
MFREFKERDEVCRVNILGGVPRYMWKMGGSGRGKGIYFSKKDGQVF